MSNIVIRIETDPNGVIDWSKHACGSLIIFVGLKIVFNGGPEYTCISVEDVFPHERRSSGISWKSRLDCYKLQNDIIETYATGPLNDQPSWVCWIKSRQQPQVVSLSSIWNGKCFKCGKGTYTGMFAVEHENGSCKL